MQPVDFSASVSYCWMREIQFRGGCSQRNVTPLPLGNIAGLVKVVLEAVIYVVPE